MSELSKTEYLDFVKRLKHHNIGEGVNEHITANPLFVVQSLIEVGGIDLNYDPPYYWTDVDHDGRMDNDELLAELNEYKDEGGIYDDFNIEYDTVVARGSEILYQKIGYSEHWEYVCSHFTKEAAEAFIARKSHDYGKLRIYVESQYWCWEFNSIIKAILSGKIDFIDQAEATI